MKGFSVEDETIAWWREPAEEKPLWKVDTFAAEYHRAMKAFFSHLVELNINLYIVERVFAFPIDLLSGGDRGKSIFFTQVINNFLNQSILLVTKLVYDQGHGKQKPVYTLRQLKNKVNKFVTDKRREELIQQLDIVDFEQRTDTLLEKAGKIRNHRIAHFTPETILGSFDQTTQPERLLFSDIKALCDALNDYYEALTFGGDCHMLPRSYKNNNSDIQWLLDSAAKNSLILNMPEQEPDQWVYTRQRLTKEEVGQLNHYRRKFGLEEI